MEMLEKTTSELNKINAIAKNFVTEVAPIASNLIGSKVFNANKMFSQKWQKEMQSNDQVAFEVSGDKLILVVRTGNDEESFSNKFIVGKIHKATGLLLSFNSEIQTTDFDVKKVLKQVEKIKETKKSLATLMNELPVCFKPLLKD